MTTLLVVDDDRDVREVLAEILRDEGYQVATATDGADALAWLRANPAPGLIILDFMMPRMDGAQFRAEQRNHPALAHIPVLMLSADARVVERAAQLDAVACLKKPIRLRELFVTIAQHARSA